MTICVWLFGLLLVVVGSRKGHVELTLVAGGNAFEVKLNCECIPCFSN